MLTSIFPAFKTDAYARSVVNGEIVAGELVIAACERHLRDRDRGLERGIYFDEGAAEKAIGFFPAVFTITAGPFEGQPFHLLDWQKFVIGSLFGWKRKSGRLRFRRAWVETGKGQAKSPLLAGMGIYMLAFYGLKRAEVYAIGETRNVSNVLFRDAAAMCQADMPGCAEGDTLESREITTLRGIGDNIWKIEHMESGSKFQALANGESISGPRPVLVLADEIHEFKSDDAIETWTRAITKMAGDAMIVLATNTPATTQVTGTYYSDAFQRVAKGEIDDDDAFGYIARVDRSDWEDVFEDQSCWPKALPALDITFPRENLIGEVKTAQTLISTAMSVKRLYFGIPTGAVSFWIDEHAWRAVQGDVDESAMRGLKCWLSLDLSQKNDLTSLSACWEDENGHFYVKTWYYTAQEGLHERSQLDNMPYERWVEEGYLIAVPGSTIEKTWVAQKVKEIIAEHNVAGLSFDPAGILSFLKACHEVDLQHYRWEGEDTKKRRGVMIVSHAQGTRIVFTEKQLCMPRSIEELEDRVLKREITIDSSPITYSCASNAAIVTDAQNNRAFDKKKSTGRIDGIVTIAMVTGTMAVDLSPKNLKIRGQIEVT